MTWHIETGCQVNKTRSNINRYGDVGKKKKHSGEGHVPRGSELQESSRLETRHASVSKNTTRRGLL